MFPHFDFMEVPGVQHRPGRAPARRVQLAADAREHDGSRAHVHLARDPAMARDGTLRADVRAPARIRLHRHADRDDLRRRAPRRRLRVGALGRELRAEPAPHHLDLRARDASAERRPAVHDVLDAAGRRRAQHHVLRQPRDRRRTDAVREAARAGGLRPVRRPPVRRAAVDPRRLRRAGQPRTDQFDARAPRQSGPRRRALPPLHPPQHRSGGARRGSARRSTAPIPGSSRATPTTASSRSPRSTETPTIRPHCARTRSRRWPTTSPTRRSHRSSSASRRVRATFVRTARRRPRCGPDGSGPRRPLRAPPA